GLIEETTGAPAADKSKQLRHRVQIVFLRPELGLSATGGFLACQQRRWDNSVEQTRTSADHDIPLGTQAVSDSQPGIHPPLRVQHACGPSLPVGAYAKVHR